MSPNRSSIPFSFRPQQPKPHNFFPCIFFLQNHHHHRFVDQTGYAYHDGGKNDTLSLSSIATFFYYWHAQPLSPTFSISAIKIITITMHTVPEISKLFPFTPLSVPILLCTFLHLLFSPKKKRTQIDFCIYLYTFVSSFALSLSQIQSQHFGFPLKPSLKQVSSFWTTHLLSVFPFCCCKPLNMYYHLPSRNKRAGKAHARANV